MTYAASIDQLIAEAKGSAIQELGYASDAYAIGHLAARLHFALEKIAQLETKPANEQ